MRLALPLALVLAATTSSRQGCRNDPPPPYDPCAEKACGDACTVCAPDDRDCAETAVVKACDPFGRCVADAPGLCGPTPEQIACTQRSCGDECVVVAACRSATPPCMVPDVLGHCDMRGTCYVGPPPPGLCLPAPPPPPSWGCVGKTCGDSCGFCPEGTDPAKCPVPTFAPTACDAQLQCVTAGTFTCPPDPCAGKACGTECDPCGGMCMHPYASACDLAGTCVPAPVTCGP
jgi:hypothetical protein